MTRSVPVSDELLVELERYKREMGSSALPDLSQPLPLVLPMRAGSEAITRQAPHNFVKQVFATTTQTLEMRGPEWATEVDRLRKASAHTGLGTRQAEEMDLVVVRNNMVHKSISTASIYLHPKEDRRHEQTTSKHRL